jgi:hypothetical protein
MNLLNHFWRYCGDWLSLCKKTMIKMKRITLYFCFFAAFLFLAQSANAQYATSLHREKANLVEGSGRILSDDEVIGLIGEAIYNETYVGAQKQIKAGRTLIWSGAAGALTGIGMMLYGQYLFTDSPYMHGMGTLTEGKIGYALCVGGLLLEMAGSAALDAGIPLLVIGKKRLDWVADNYNGGVNLACHVGVTPHGVGLTLRF